MPHKVFILTGLIQTGKTTSLIEWCAEKKNIHGILTPIVDGKRMFMDISTKEMFAMEAGEGETTTLKVGRFIFSAFAFEKANAIIINASERVAHFQKSEPLNYIIIDEVGPLELRQEGLFKAVRHTLQNQTGPIILVVREGLVDKVIEYFHIKTPSIITKTTLELL